MSTDRWFAHGSGWREKPSGSHTRQEGRTDVGFDLTPAHDRNGMIFRSSAFPQALAVVAQADGTYRVTFSDAAWGHKVAHDGAVGSRKGRVDASAQHFIQPGLER
jgi:hypothetical protein